MKKIIVFFLGLFCISYTVYADSYIERQKYHKDIAPKIESSKCSQGLTVASFATNPPFGWVEFDASEDGLSFSLTAHGYAIELMQKIGQEINVPITPVAFKSDEEASRAFQEGYVDILMGQYYDPKMRGLHHVFLAPAFFPNVISIVFMKGKEKEVKTFDDLKGLKGVFRIDEGFYTYIRRQIPEDLDLQPVPDSREAFTHLITGQADYLMASPYSAEAEARRFKLNQEIKMIQTPLLGQELFALFSAHAPCQNLRNEIANKLAEKRGDLAQTKRDLISYIDKWGLRFIDTPSLRDQLEKEKDQNPIE